jgi:tRNA(Ile)-lysidine synthase
MNNSEENIAYWVACSGGVDSVVLVRLFKELGKNFGVLHCNFKLRAEDSEADENFVRELANEIGVPFKVKVFDVEEYIKKNGGNTQLAARELRYSWFEEVKTATDSKIVLGHHKDDQIETFLLQLRRGGKLKGLACMNDFTNGYLRPLLKYTKVELYDLARLNNWSWREDLSNQKSDYLRNYYRNEIIPCFPQNKLLKTQVIKLIDDFQVLLNFSENYLNTQFEFRGNITVSFDLWDSWPQWIKHLFISNSGLSPFSVHEVNRLRETEKGKYLRNKFKSIWNEGNYFFIRKTSDTVAFKEYKIELISVNDVFLKKGVVFIAKEKVQGDIFLEKWTEGDVFRPLGMSGQKKVSKFLRDRKVPSSKKINYPVILDELGRILGVAGMCPDENFKLDKNTEWVYRVHNEFISSE